MLIAVLDDTGTHESAEYSSCIGIVAGLQHWRRFEREWRAELAKYGVEDFHAQRFYARDQQGERVGLFRGWDDKKAYRFIRSMMSLFSVMKAEVIGATVDTAAFRNLSARERAFLTGQMVDIQTGKGYGHGAPNKPFQLAFACAVNLAFSYGKNKIPLSVVLDQNDFLAKQAATIWYQLHALSRYPGLVQEFQTLSRKNAVSLHVADLTAYLWNRYLTKGKLTEEQTFAMQRIGAKEKSIMRLDADSLSRLRNSMPDIFDVLDIPVP